MGNGIFHVTILFCLPLICWSGLTFISGDDSDDYGHCETAASCNGLIVTIFSSAIALSGVKNTAKDVLALGVNGGQAIAALTSWQAGAAFTVDIMSSDLEIMNVDFSQYKVIYMPSSSGHTSGGITCYQLSLVTSRADEIKYFVNTLRGSLITLTQETCSGTGYTFLAVPLETLTTSVATVTIQTALTSVVTTLSPTSLNHCCYHTLYPGPAGYGGLNVLAIDPSSGYPLILGGWNVILTAEICTDGIDNDEDGFIDLADLDCAEIFCADGLDNNGNGLADCDDPACQSSWPPCIRDLELTGIKPQHNCQGSLVVVNDVVQCHQIGRFQTIFDFYKYPQYNTTNTSTTSNNSGSNITDTPTSVPTSSPTTPLSLPPAVIQSFVLTGEEDMEDTMYNCGFDLSTSFQQSLFLFTSNFKNNPLHEVARHSYTAQSPQEQEQQSQQPPTHIQHQTPYYMIQKYNLPSSQLVNRTIQSVLLFQKGQFGGNGTSFIYPAQVNWTETVTCQDLGSVGASIYHEDCYTSGPAQIIHIYGWTYVNITNMITCQLRQLFQDENIPILGDDLSFTSVPEMMINFGYLWVEDSVSMVRQGWYSSESLFSPQLVFFYKETNMTIT